ncbi:primosomal protein N' (replication factor Y) - superfamily II helicase [Amylibacter sp. SFDW26]|uniref:primosomal protein N' (replication factor Y) - superfamily II helicase n=1 Tax=Amylibacter sp. SFDW26 TaxID=2652722 RepID=UPI0012616392|nr:primosomal protein N' (replication factor Y) - superfamily II helicase [Amylibacter sp. SFDW26]KAB7610361.1 primosomal protein N' (replication factor Y) - superfamily II helicase [Amylibacter sp. SFDW26]
MTTEVEEHRFPCDTCGSDLRYSPGTSLLHCDHCGSEEKITNRGVWKKLSIRELDFRKAVKDQLPEQDMEELRTVSCVNCGAHVEFEPNIHSTECPFCATPLVTDTGTDRQIKPKGLLPFELAEKDARKRMTDWLGRLWFAPNGLQDYARKGRKMQGIYVPYWTYDADTKSSYTGQRGTIYYETRRVAVNVNGRRQMQNRQVQRIRWTHTSGRVARFFDDVLVLGSKSLPKKYTDALAPWDLSALEPYRPEYLAGFRAESYTVQLDEGYKEARDYMNRMIVRDVKFDIGGDRQKIGSLDTEIGTLTFKHVLLPVWLAAYKYRGKTYRFVVNGRTGTVQGERPYSAWKIAFTVGLGLLAAAAIGFLIAQGNAGNVSFTNY